MFQLPTFKRVFSFNPEANLKEVTLLTERKKNKPQSKIVDSVGV